MWEDWLQHVTQRMHVVSLIKVIIYWPIFHSMAVRAQDCEASPNIKHNTIKLNKYGGYLSQYLIQIVYT